jgi:DNA (cytosine-5)-methyltransferase 1
MENFGPHSVAGDIQQIVLSGVPIPHADVIIGGPPCQGFSLLNKNRANDLRKGLWRAYWTIVQRVEPSVFVMENVPELLASPEFFEFRRTAQAAGWRIVADILNAADFGVPQRRRRAFVIGSRLADPSLPRATHAHPDYAGDSGLSPWRTVFDAIGDLPEPEGVEPRPDLRGPLDLHFGRTPTEISLARYRAVPAGGNRFDLLANRPDITPGCWVRKTHGGTDLFGRLWWHRPSVTIRTEFFKPEKGRYLHPEQDRPITHREAARLQTFPDTFRFVGTKTEIARQIGNAVPCVLATAIAAHVREHLATHAVRAAM